MRDRKMNPELQNSLEEIKKIFLILTGTPEPEEEEQAQKDLLRIFENLINLVDDEQSKNLASELKTIISNWDTLEQWFTEVEGLSNKLRDLLSIYTMLDSSKTEESQDDILPQGDTDKDEIDEKQQQMNDLEARMKELEEKERLLKQKEMELEKKEKSMTQQSSPPKLTSSLSSKLAVPKISVPKVSAPKQIVKPSSTPEHKAGIKIDLGASAQLEKMGGSQEQKINISENISGGPKIKPVSKPMGSSDQNNGLKIKPVGNSPVSSENKILKIKAVGAPPRSTNGGAEAPKIKLVGGSGGPSIKPVGDSSSPAIKPVGGSSGPSIRPVGNSSGPSIKPVGSISKPSIRPAGTPQKPSISVDGAQRVDGGSGQIPAPQKGPVNLFDAQPKKGPLNLFDKTPGKSSTNDTEAPSLGSGQVSRRESGGAIEKVGGLEKIDFNISGPESLKTHDSYYAKLPPEAVYQELLKAEAKRYYFDKNLKNLDERYSKGGLDEGEYRGQKERFRFEIDTYSDKIKEIRNMILGIN